MPFKEIHPLYQTWLGMKARCVNKNNKHYKNYGGRGILVCNQWINNFKQFAKDMGDKPKGFSLDRINNDGNYEPSNCKWSTRKEQQRNRRVTNFITIEGKTYTVAEIAENYGFKYDTIKNRAKTAKTFQDLVDKNKKVFTEGLALGGKASGLKKQQLTHCKYGHEFTLENTYITKQGWRRCRKCRHIA